MLIRIKRRKIQWLLQIQKRVLRTCRYTHNIQRKNRPNTRVLYTSVVRRRNNSNTRKQTRPRKKLFDVLNKLEKAGFRASKKKSEFFMKREVAGTRDRQKRKKTEGRKS